MCCCRPLTQTMYLNPFPQPLHPKKKTSEKEQKKESEKMQKKLEVMEREISDG